MTQLDSHLGIVGTVLMLSSFRLGRGRLSSLNRDLQNARAEIPRLAEMLEDWDCVSRMRFPWHGGGIESDGSGRVDLHGGVFSIC